MFDTPNCVLADQYDHSAAWLKMKPPIVELKPSRCSVLRNSKSFFHHIKETRLWKKPSTRTATKRNSLSDLVPPHSIAFACISAALVVCCKQAKRMNYPPYKLSLYHIADSFLSLMRIFKQALAKHHLAIHSKEACLLHYLPSKKPEMTPTLQSGHVEWQSAVLSFPITLIQSSLYGIMRVKKKWVF